MKVLPLTQRTRRWRAAAERFARAVAVGLARAHAPSVTSRARPHVAACPEARRLGPPADYAPLAVNETTAAMRPVLALRGAGRKPSFPKVRRAGRSGLDVNAYAVGENDRRFVLRVSMGDMRLPPAVPELYRRPWGSSGDARRVRRPDGWYADLPVRTAGGCQEGQSRCPQP